MNGLLRKPLLGLCYTALLAATTANANISYVTSTADSGSGSLRNVIGAAAPGDTIVFDVMGAITLTSGELVIGTSITILGPGPTYVTVSGNSASRVFDISSGITANISGLTIENGFTNAPGGALYNLAALVLSNCVVTGSSSLGNPLLGGIGGAIYNGGTMSLAYCTITNNFAAGTHNATNTGNAFGGAIYNAGVLTLNSCAVSSNWCAPATSIFIIIPPGNGGGIYNTNTLTINGCTINNNAAAAGMDSTGNGPGIGGAGGGVYNGGLLTVANSTANGNSSGAGGSGQVNSFGGGSGGNGGGFWNGGSLLMIGCTVSSNSAGAGGTGYAYAHQQSGGSGGSGGGIYNVGSLALTNCTIMGNASGGGGSCDLIVGTSTPPIGGNAGSGGGIANSGSLAASGCTVSGNACGSGGGGGFGNPATGGVGGNGGSGGGVSGGGTLINCTIYRNSSGSGGSGGPSADGNGGAGGNGGSGGGVSGGGTLINCTIASNSIAQGGSGGVVVYGGGSPGQSGSPGAGGGICCSAQLLNTIVDNDQSTGSGPDVSGSFTSLGYNLIGNTSGSSGFGATGDLLNVSPQLAPLANNGGPTLTCALLVGSPAIDAGDDAVLSPPYNLSTDQRGLPRKSSFHVDIGAFEFQAPFAIASITIQGSAVNVSWTTLGGSTNVLQVSPGAPGGGYSNNFADLSPQIIITGAGPETTNYPDISGATNSYRYYRVRLVAP